MKNLILLFCFLLSGITISQNITFKDGIYQQNGVAYSGIYTTYFESGNIKEEMTIKDGKLNGSITKKYEDGTNMEVGNYENNLKFGLWTRYNVKGHITAQASYLNDKKDGNWFVYDDNGTKLFEMSYKDGEKVGIWKQWDEKGELIKTTNYSSL